MFLTFLVIWDMQKRTFDVCRNWLHL